MTTTPTSEPASNSALHSVPNPAQSLEQAKRRFSVLVQEHEASLFGYLSRLGLSDSAVNDVAQEAFLRAWRYRDRYDESTS